MHELEWVNHCSGPRQRGRCFCQTISELERSIDSRRNNCLTSASTKCVLCALLSDSTGTGRGMRSQGSDSAAPARSPALLTDYLLLRVFC